MGGFVQGTDGRHPEMHGIQAGNARPATVDAQPPGFGEFRGATFSFAFEAIGSGKIGADDRVSRIGIAAGAPSQCIDTKNRLPDRGG